MTAILVNIRLGKVKNMTDYRKLYLRLFNRVTDALENMAKRNYIAAEHILVAAQQECEELFIAQGASAQQHKKENSPSKTGVL